MTQKTSLTGWDQIIMTAVTFIVVALLSWIALTGYTNSSKIVQIQERVLAMKESRDLSYLEKRMDSQQERIEGIAARLRVLESNAIRD